MAGKTAVVTGGTTGIGRSTALLLAKQGTRVLIFGRHEKELKDALKDIEPAGEVQGTVGGLNQPLQFRLNPGQKVHALERALT